MNGEKPKIFLECIYHSDRSKKEEVKKEQEIQENTSTLWILSLNFVVAEQRINTFELFFMSFLSWVVNPNTCALVLAGI